MDWRGRYSYIMSLMFIFLQTSYLALPTQGNEESGAVEGSWNYIAPLKRLEDLEDPKLEQWDPPEHLKEAFPYYISGYDEEGQPVFVYEVGKYNFRKHWAEGPEAIRQVETYFDQLIGRFILRAKKSPTREAVFIYDFDGFSLDKIASAEATSFFLKLMAKFGKSYPVLSYAFIVNVNFPAEIFLNSLRVYVSKLMDKIETYGTRKQQWLPKLLRKIPADQLPPWYGGVKDFKPVSTFG